MNLNLFKKKHNSMLKRNYLECDIHSHLIPCIDDGTKSIDESVEIIKRLRKLGYRKIITTPHVMVDFYKNSTADIINGMEKLKVAIKKEKIDIEIEAAAEYYLDEGFLNRLENKDILSFASSYLLFETSYISKPNNLEEIIFQIQSDGFIPVMAHPERYKYIQGNLKIYKYLKDIGILFQCNINSFAGYYGEMAQKNIKILSKNGLIDFFGSDIHKIKHLEVLEQVILTKEFKDTFNKNNILNNTKL